MERQFQIIEEKAGEGMKKTRQKHQTEGIRWSSR